MGKKGNVSLLFAVLAISAIALIAIGNLASAAGNQPGGNRPGGPGNMGNERGNGGPGNGQGDQPQNGQGNGNSPIVSQESIDACDDKSEDDSCSFTPSGQSDSVSGTCMKAPARGQKGNNSSDGEEDGSELACMPGKKESDSSDELARAERMKTDKERQISGIEKRTEKLIDFLDSKDVDTDDIESNLSTFKDKADDLLDDIDKYIKLLKDDDSDSDDVSDALSTVKSESKILAAYYRDTLKKSIDSALEELD